MKILVTGAKGFVGKNLCAQLKNIKDGKVRYYGDITIEEVFVYDLDSTLEELDTNCATIYSFLWIQMNTLNLFDF